MCHRQPVAVAAHMCHRQVAHSLHQGTKMRVCVLYGLPTVGGCCQLVGAKRQHQPRAGSRQHQMRVCVLPRDSTNREQAADSTRCAFVCCQETAPTESRQQTAPDARLCVAKRQHQPRAGSRLHEMVAARLHWDAPYTTMSHDTILVQSVVYHQES
jgi:hypothetical protein